MQIREISELEDKETRATNSLAKIDRDKEIAIAEAKFPIAGLGFSEDGVTFNGIPLEQCAESQRTDVSLSIGSALNPNGVMLMPQSGGLDSEARSRIVNRAKELGVQLVFEVVDCPDDVTMIINNGKVA